LKKSTCLAIVAGVRFNQRFPNRQITEEEREHRLINWESAPAARYCHPREEHLLPPHVCYGAASTAAKRVFEFEIMGKMASAYSW